MTLNQTDIPTAGDTVDYHREEALAFAESAELLGDAIEQAPINSEQYRRLNQKLGVALKLATMHADLAVAVSQSVVVGAVHHQSGPMFTDAALVAKATGARA